MHVGRTALTTEPRSANNALTFTGATNSTSNSRLQYRPASCCQRRNLVLLDGNAMSGCRLFVIANAVRFGGRARQPVS